MPQRIFHKPSLEFIPLPKARCERVEEKRQLVFRPQPAPNI
jgi:hypothetical protein